MKLVDNPPFVFSQGAHILGMRKEHPMPDTSPAETVSVKVPFSGFYNTIHDGMIDMTLEQINTDDAGDEVEVIGVGNVRWAEVHLAYAQTWLKEACEASGLDMQFEKIVSPRDYYMGNDMIIARVTLDSLEAAYAGLTQDERASWRDLVSEELTERPGFVPYSKYPRDADQWGPVSNWDDAQRDLFFHFRAAPLIDEAGLAERASEMLDDAIWRAVIDPDIVPGHVDNANEAGLEA